MSGRTGPPVPVGRYFTLAEFRDRHAGVMPPADSHAAIRELCEHYLDPLRRRFGRCTVYSGYRTRATNVEVGGVPQSRHRYDRYPHSVAADVGFATGTPKQWHAAAEKLLQSRHGLGLYPGHIHIDVRSEYARW